MFSKFETGRLQALLNWTPLNSQHAPAHDFAEPDTAAMTVLAVLAHEVGHIFWYDAFVIKPDSSPNPGGPADFSKFCSGTFYQPSDIVQQGSWLLPPTVPDYRWVSFGNPRERPTRGCGPAPRHPIFSERRGRDAGAQMRQG